MPYLIAGFAINAFLLLDAKDTFRSERHESGRGFCREIESIHHIVSSCISCSQCR